MFRLRAFLLGVSLAPPLGDCGISPKPPQGSAPDPAQYVLTIVLLLFSASWFLDIGCNLLSPHKGVGEGI